MFIESVLDIAIKFLKPEIFYKEVHQVIFRKCVELYDKNIPVDALSVANALKKSDQLELIGGRSYLSNLINTSTTTVNTENHCRILLEQWMKRELVKISYKTAKDSFDDTEDVFDTVKKLDDGLRNLMETVTSGGRSLSAKDIVEKFETEIKHREKLAKNGIVHGVKTGLAELDKITGGWQKGEVITLASRPSMGKTSLLVHFAKSAAESGTPVCIYSLEMSDISLMSKVVLSVSNVNVDNLRSGRMTDSDWDEFNKSKTIIQKLPLYIDDNPIVSIRYIRAHARIMKKRGLCGLIGIDYLQLTDMRQDEKNRNREQEVAQTSRMAKIIAKELNVPVLLLSQLNRRAEERNDKRPILSDLRESGAIEQDSDMVIFIYRPEYYKIFEDNKGRSLKGYGELILAKHRNGAVCDVPFGYNMSLTKIFNYDEFRSARSGDPDSFIEPKSDFPF